MATKRRLTPEEWAQVRRRWEGAPEEGFAWLAAEIEAAWGVAIGRPGVAMKASRDGWTKGEPAGGPLRSGESQSQGPSQPASQSQKRQDVTPAAKPAASKARAPRAAPAKLPAPATEESVTDIGEDGKPVESQPNVKPWIPKPAPLGRPTKYRAEFAEELIRYFSVEPFETVIGENGRAVQVPSKFPMFEAFAAKIGVTTQTLHHWATEQDEEGNRRRPEFSDAYARARSLQNALLVQGTMAGAYEPRFATLAAKNLIGWRDKVEVQADTTSTSREQLEATYVLEMEAARERMAKVIQERKAIRGESA